VREITLSTKHTPHGDHARGDFFAAVIFSPRRFFRTGVRNLTRLS
jgi:hypothetical protein